MLWLTYTKKRTYICTHVVYSWPFFLPSDSGFVAFASS